MTRPTVFQFKRKIGPDGTFKLPKTITREHALQVGNDKIGSGINITFLSAIITRELRRKGIYDKPLHIDDLPDCVTVSEQGFLSTIQLTMRD